LDGDGWTDKKGVHWSSCNLNLILQGRDLLLSAGIPSSIYKIDHAKCDTSGYANSGLEYTLNVSWYDVAPLVDWSEKIATSLDKAPTSERNKPASLYPIANTFAYRIKRVERRDVVDQPTWNIEVADDASYSLVGLTSHNCKVAYDVCACCGNKARNRSEYCLGTDEGGMCKAGGCRNRLGQVNEDGSIVHVHNPDPLFFDISKVWKPADRIAYVLGQIKEAYAKGGVPIGGAELAERLGIEQPFDIALESVPEPRVRKLMKVAKALSDLAKNDYSQSGAFLPAVQPEINLSAESNSYEFKADALKALAMCKSALSLKEYLRFTRGKDMTKTAERVNLLMPRIFATLADDPDDLAMDLRIGIGQFSERKPSADADTWAHKTAAHYNYDPSEVRKREWLAELRQAKVGKENSMLVKLAAHDDELKLLAREYALYKVAFLEESTKTGANFELTADLVLRSNPVS